ncbi:MAG: hypothetical protein A2W99_16565 [Bacteroidetes bacterium GWF2_33_16]|nr:MAG: hypothetical protein A2X00_14230 [Bacteroidetes bacterium GWE2_32_14]OFY03363.1 MAG: hypothetical protein A2W99_16565 [Bacteroidetes bacterium GWF2_33_16]
MKPQLRLFTFLFLISNVVIAQQPNSEFPKLTGPYLGQKPPGMTPELFAPGIISTNNTEWTTAFSPDGLELFYTIQGLNNYNVLVYIKSVNGVWQQPELAPFRLPDHNADPFFTQDGKRLFFWSNGPDIENQESRNNSDIYYVDKVGDGWGKPIRLDTNLINTNQWQIFPTVARNGNLYFTCNYPDSRGAFDVYMSEFKDGKYQKPVNLGDSINTTTLEQEPFIAPDESYIIFASDRHAPRTNNWDLYISFKKEDGTWTTAKNMGKKINSSAKDMAAMVTHDGKYLFFSSYRVKEFDPSSEDFSYKVLKEALNGPQNGNSDVYWVDAKIIDELR